MQARSIKRILTAAPASDGGGVKLHRIVAPDGMRGLDPFLLLDDFGSDEAQDYLAGFPPHPHRGFETLTYMLEGRMLHEDHLGHRGLLESGGVQWMTAGRGVIHSEMPQQEAGRMHGMQLWVNLPAAEKMKDPAYRNLPAEEIPVVKLPDGVSVKVVAGIFSDGEREIAGAAQGISTDPLYLDVRMPLGASLEMPVERGHQALVYLYEGELQIAGEPIVARQMAVLGDGDRLILRAKSASAGALVLAASPLGEPVVHHGPFVMTTREEIRQAIADYESGRLTAV
ncbi:pirin family protein [Thiorhodococcus mannitoliphagus]|uniref:Pirin family protein n=1 Tax=Thiorhodococcus mannitoliphagus TaxID=329406 RepID=A0A6P1E020_9GAMM|nr:pirin family protein [Thiorhodococcus mannitoliphagus]NEX21105.1 pirin family protein [Thiorhodococcus mannitoliphagus]